MIFGEKKNFNMHVLHTSHCKIWHLFGIKIQIYHLIDSYRLYSFSKFVKRVLYITPPYTPQDTEQSPGSLCPTAFLTRRSPSSVVGLFSFSLYDTCTVQKSNPNFRDITWNVEENEILYYMKYSAWYHVFPLYISCYIAENRLTLWQCGASEVV